MVSHKITDPKNKAESAIRQTILRKKRAEIIHAVQYCKTNNCRGYKAIQANDYKHVVSPLTINAYLDGNKCLGRAKYSNR